MTREQFHLLTAGRLIYEGFDADEIRRILKLAKKSRTFQAIQEYEGDRLFQKVMELVEAEKQKAAEPPRSS